MSNHSYPSNSPKPGAQINPAGRRVPPVRDLAVKPSVPGQKPMATKPRGSRTYSKTEMAVAIGIGGFALVILGVIAMFSFYVLFTLSNRIMPGVMVGNTSIGNMDIEEASQVLWTNWNENRTLFVTDGSHFWSDTPAQFGLYLDSASTTLKAYEIGRGKDGLSQFFNLLTLGNLHVSPEVVVNMEITESKLALYAELIDVPATDAALKYEDGEWVAIPGETGIALDIPHTAADLVTKRAVVLTSGIFTFTLMPVQPQFEDMTTALEKVKPMLERPMRFKAYDPILDEILSWTVEPKAYASWIRIENLQGDPNLTVSAEPFGSYIQGWQEQELGSRRILQQDYEIDDLVKAWKEDNVYSFTIWHKENTYTVQPGDMLTEVAYYARMPYWKIIEANPEIDPENLITGQTLVIPSKNEMLPLPIVLNKRIVINISHQRLWTYENGEMLKEYVISTGVDESPTIPGVFQVQTHELEAYASVWDLYMPHFIGIYEGWPGFWNGMHGLPTLSSGVRLWGSVLGHKASFGCIILDLASAETIYHWAENGVVVEIQP